MFCLKCGNKIEDGESFCTKCGEKVEVIQENSDTQPKKKNKKALVGISIGAAAVIVAAVVVISIFIGNNDSRIERPFEQYKKGLNKNNVELCLDAMFPKEFRKRMEKEIKKKDIDVTNSSDYYSKAEDMSLIIYCKQKYYAMMLIDQLDNPHTIDTFEMDDPNYDYSDGYKQALETVFNIDASDIAFCDVNMAGSVKGKDYENSEDAYLYQYKGKWYFVWE